MQKLEVHVSISPQPSTPTLTTQDTNSTQDTRNNTKDRDTSRNLNNPTTTAITLFLIDNRYMPTLLNPFKMTSDTTSTGNGCVRESSGATATDYLRRYVLIIDEEWLLSYELMRMYYSSEQPISWSHMSRLNPWLKRNKQEYALFKQGVTEGHSMTAGKERSGRRS